MSKQGMDARKYLTAAQYELGVTLYKAALRAAVKIAAVPTRLLSPRKKAKVEHSGSMLFRGLASGGEQEVDSPMQPVAEDYDPVVNEITPIAHPR